MVSTNTLNLPRLALPLLNLLKPIRLLLCGYMQPSPQSLLIWSWILMPPLLIFGITQIKSFTTTNTAQLDNKIRNMKHGNKMISDYFQDIKNKADRIANLGVIVSDSNLITYAINRLGKKVSHTARIVCHRETLADFETIRSMVLLEENVLNNDDEEQSYLQNTTSSATVLVAANTSNKNPTTMSSSGIEQCQNFQRGSHDHRPRNTTCTSARSSTSHGPPL
ncbi:hypothetical protein Tco_0178886 [Tanacetum coccineum]